MARKNRLKKKQNYEKNPNLFTSVAATTQSVPSKKEPVRASPVEPRSSPSPVAAPSPAPAPQAAPPSSSSSPLERKPSFDFFQSDAPPSPVPRPASAPSAPGIVVDDIDDGAPAPAAAPLSREELRARREANVQERVQEALKFKQEVLITVYRGFSCDGYPSWMRIREERKKTSTTSSASMIKTSR